MEFGIIEILKLIGSLGFFIYGMKVMSEGVQKIAGSKMRQILSTMTSNRYKGIVAGFLLTSLVQSSSATTVMVVSFVNAGLLSLVESIGVIMGANIGTTVTAWLVSVFAFGKVKIAAMALPILAFGFPMMFFRNNRLQSIGEFLIGFSLLFMGLDYLKHSVPDIKHNPEVLEFLAAYTSNGFFSILLFVFVGTVLTVVVQSSSAAMTLTLTLLANGIISYEFAAAMVLGENIGTTITANLAALIGNVHAKRAARAHFIFNMFGVVWMLVLFYPFLALQNLLWEPFVGFIKNINPDSLSNASQLQLSLFHTSFNIINTVVLMNFVNFIARLVIKMVPSKGDDDEFRLEYIGTPMTTTAEISILEAKKEIAKFGKIASRMSGFTKALIGKKKLKPRPKFMEKIKRYEEITDRVEIEISEYLSKVAQGNLSQASTVHIRRMLGIINDLERIGDIFFQISLRIEKKNQSNVWFSEEQKTGLMEMLELIDEGFEVMVQNLESSYDSVTIDQAIEVERKINAKRNELKRYHLEKVQTGEYPVMNGLIFSEIFNLIEKIGDHIINVSEGVTGEYEKDFFEQKENIV